MSAGEMADMVLDLYTARKEAREYLDYYVSPDIEAKKEQLKAVLEKETARFTRRSWKVRITVFKKELKKFDSYQPDDETRASTYSMAVIFALSTAGLSRAPENFRKSVLKLLHDAIVVISQCGMLKNELPSIVQTIEQLGESWGTGYFKRSAKTELEDTLASISFTSSLS